MTIYSQNGYPANDITLTDVFTVPGTSVRLRIRKGAVAQALIYLADQYNKRVEPIGAVQDDWGYAERTVRGGTALSNHASGTAIDLNATAHPLGTEPVKNYSQAQIDTIHKILTELYGVVRWGGDYTGRKDGMHFEIIKSEVEVQIAVDHLLNHGGNIVSVNAPPVAVLTHANWGQGYIVVTSDGGVFTFLNAPFYGSLGGIHINAPIVDAVVTPTGLGYKLIGRDGGDYNFGDSVYGGRVEYTGP